jgi:cytochrome c2
MNGVSIYNVRTLREGSLGSMRTASGSRAGSLVLGALLSLSCGGSDSVSTDHGWTVDTLSDYLLEPTRFRRDDPRVRDLQRYYPEVTMPEFDYPEGERRALAAWLLADPAAVRTTGEALYRDWSCALCHGEDRQGTELGPPLVILQGAPRGR